METRSLLSRRALLARGLGASATIATSGLIRGIADAAYAQSPALAADAALPSPQQVMRDYQRMVDFGPRLTGTDAHDRFVAYLQDELEKAGCYFLPPDVKSFDFWGANGWSLEILDGPAKGPVKVSSYFPRSGETPPGGITATLVAGTDPSAISGNVLVMESALPPRLTESFLESMASYYHWSGHPPDPSRDYHRAWVATVGANDLLAQAKSLGAAAVVLILDCSYDAAVGNWCPFNTDYVGLPALWVDRDTGTVLLEAAVAAPSVRFTLTAEKRKATSPSIVGILPGETNEAVILNTHTDGQNAFEENAGVAMVHLARYLSSLPPEQRLKRAVVFSLVTGHMTSTLPQTQGFIDDHPDLVGCAAAALTIEHFGSAEWVDDASGYHATGDPEVTGIWTSQGRMLTEMISSVGADDIPHAYLLRPKPLYLGIGGAFQDAGVPNIGFIAGPGHLVSIVPNGHIDKLDTKLAAQQTRWIAHLLHQLDGISAADLATGDTQLTRSSVGTCGSLETTTAAATGASGAAGSAAGGEAAHPGAPGRRRFLAASTHLTRHGFGWIQPGKTRTELENGPVKPMLSSAHSLTWAVEGSRARVLALFPSTHRHAKAELVLGSTPAQKGKQAVGRGDTVNRLRSHFPHTTTVAPGVIRLARQSSSLAVVSRGKVDLVGVAEPALLHDDRRLRRLLRFIGR